MTTVIIKSLENLQHQIIVDGHALIADEPKSIGGDGLGPTPYDLLLGALGACTSMTLLMYARRKGWALRGVEVWLSHNRLHMQDCENCEEPNRYMERITREFVLIGDLDESQKNRLKEIAQKCPVHKTLQHELQIVDIEPDVRPV